MGWGYHRVSPQYRDLLGPRCVYPSLVTHVPHASLVRIVGFSAGHHYRRRDWSEERNHAVFGGSVNPHGHNYRVEVTVGGEVDAETGFVVDLGQLDAVLAELIHRPLDQQDLNRVIPEVETGQMTPSTENLALWLWNRLDGRIPGTARLERLRVFESDTLAAEVRA